MKTINLFILASSLQEELKDVLDYSKWQKVRVETVNNVKSYCFFIEKDKVIMLEQKDTLTYIRLPINGFYVWHEIKGDNLIGLIEEMRKGLK